MKPIKHILILGLIFSLFSFSVDCDKMIKKQMKTLTGTWELIKTDCCGRINRTSKATPGEKQLTFYENGKLDVSSAGKIKESTYKLYQDKNFDEKATLLNIGKEDYPAMYNVKGDTLTISWGYMDLQTEYYVRQVAQ